MHECFIRVPRVNRLGKSRHSRNVFMVLRTEAISYLPLPAGWFPLPPYESRHGSAYDAIGQQDGHFGRYRRGHATRRLPSRAGYTDSFA
jgi:hypothetical protein